MEYGEKGRFYKRSGKGSVKRVQLSFSPLAPQDQIAKEVQRTDFKSHITCNKCSASRTKYTKEVKS